jgi:hypothetical protein
LAVDQFGRQCRQPIIPAFRPAIFDSEILAVDIANVAQALAECAESGRRLSW